MHTQIDIYQQRIFGVKKYAQEIMEFKVQNDRRKQPKCHG